MHRLILNKIEAGSAGRYRTQNAKLTETDVILPNPVKVPNLMEEFVGWLVRIDRADLDKFIEQLKTSAPSS